MRPIAHAFLYYMLHMNPNSNANVVRAQIQQIDDIARRVAVALEEVGKVNLSLAHRLASSALQKATLIAEATKCVIDLSNLVTDKPLLSSLRSISNPSEYGKLWYSIHVF